MVQNFGGEWTEDKLRTLESYAKMFATALSNKFTLHYIDAFAGDGEGASPASKNDIRQQAMFPDNTRVIEGSASRLAQLKFHHIHLIENKEANIISLKKLISQKDIINAKVYFGDANHKALEILDQLGGGDRVLLFFDPFGLQVRWETLEAIAKHEVNCDVWYLFPFQRINASITNKSRSITPGMKESLKNCLGLDEPEIISSIFEDKDTPDLFEADLQPSQRQERGIEHLFVKRLEEIFSYVNPESLKLVNSRNGHLFSLLLCSNNPSPKAHNLIKKFANHAIKK